MPRLSDLGGPGTARPEAAEGVTPTLVDPKPLRMLWVTGAWGACFVLIEVALQDASPLWLAAMRAGIGGIALAGVVAVRRIPRPRGTRTWMLIAALGLVNIAFGYAAMFVSATGVSTGVASVLANLQPILILLPAWWLFRERPSLLTITAMFVGIVGVVLILAPTNFGGGAWLAVISAGATTVGTLIGRLVKADPFVVAAGQLLIGSAILASFAGLIEGVPRIDWNPRLVVVVLLMALVGTAATTVAWFTEAQRARLHVLATWTLLVPVFGVALSVLLLGERQSPWGWVGTVIVLVSMLLLVVPRARLALPVHLKTPGRRDRVVPPPAIKSDPRKDS